MRCPPGPARGPWRASRSSPSPRPSVPPYLPCRPPGTLPASLPPRRDARAGPRSAPRRSSILAGWDRLSRSSPPEPPTSCPHPWPSIPEPLLREHALARLHQLLRVLAVDLALLELP